MYGTPLLCADASLNLPLTLSLTLIMPSTSVTTTVQDSSQLETPQQIVAMYDSDNFFWSYTEEPHRTRRQAIIKAHPEVWNTQGLSASVLANDSHYR